MFWIMVFIVGIIVGGIVLECNKPGSLGLISEGLKHIGNLMILAVALIVMFILIKSLF